jgi:hypothetical protein
LNITTVQDGKKEEDWRQVNKCLRAEGRDGTPNEAQLKLFRKAEQMADKLFKEFNISKRSREYARVRIDRVGQINTNALHSYKFDDNIFKSIETINEGDRYGFNILLDWSGSMNKIIYPAIEQSLSFVLFCKKANIPCSVIAFTDYRGEQTPEEYQKQVSPQNSVMQPAILFEIFSNQMTVKQLKDHTVMLLNGCHGGRGKYYLNGTPLLDAIWAMKNKVLKFKQQYNIDVMNLVVISDGAGTTPSRLYNEIQPYSHNQTKRLQFGSEMFIASINEASSPFLSHQYVNRIRKLGIKTTGIFLVAERRDVRNVRAVRFDLDIKTVNLRDGIHELKIFGYDNYAIVKMDMSDVPDVLSVDVTTKGRMLKSFNEMVANDSIHRPLLKFLSKSVI